MKKPRKSRTASKSLSEKSDQEIELKNLEKKKSAVAVQTQWEGPLPPPVLLGAYGDVVENGAERVFRQFEKEADHRRSVEQATHDAVVRDIFIGKIFAIVFALSALLFAAFAVAYGAEWAAAIVGGGAIGTVVLAFLNKQSDSSQEEE